MPIDEQYYESLLGNSQDNEQKYTPVGNYSLGIDKDGKITIVPTITASKYSDVVPEEYVTPEYFVYPRGKVKMLIGPDGKPAASREAAEIINYEKHRPLNPYAAYMLDRGVAPKDNLVEHLLQRYRANLAGERSDLSPFFANLLTGMYATAAREGWTDILNGKYFTGASEVLSPLMFGESAWNKVAQGIYGGVHLLNENGVPKTWREIKEGNYGNAALSAAGDALNLTMATVGGNQVYNSILELLAARGNTWSRARLLSNAIRNSELLDTGSPELPNIEHYRTHVPTFLESLRRNEDWLSRLLAADGFKPRIQVEIPTREYDPQGSIYHRLLLKKNIQGDAWFEPFTNNMTFRNKDNIFGTGLYAHERDHAAMYNLSDDFNPYTVQLWEEILQRAMSGESVPIIDFSPRPVPKLTLLREAMPWILKDDELGAVRRQFQYQLSKNGNLSDVALDKAIANASDGEIARMLMEQGYTKGFIDDLKNITHIDAIDVYSPEMLDEVISLHPEIQEAINNVRRSLLSTKSNLITKVTSPSGRIRLRLPSHTLSAPREFTIEPAGDNKFYIHMRTWDDVLNHVPASDLTPELRQSLFLAVYDELPEGAEILLPESGPGNYATRGTISGLLRLSRDPRFRRGNPGVVLYNDNGVIKTFNGTSFIKDSGADGITIGPIRGIEGTPRITEENAMLISPEEWNRQFIAAEARGDVEEGQRLRILYSMTKHPDDMTLSKGRPIYFFHSSEEPLTFNRFDLSRTGLNFSEEVDGIGSDRFGRGTAWFSAKIPDDSYGEYNRRFLLHLKDAEYGGGDLLMPDEVTSNIDDLDGVIGRFGEHNIAGETAVFDPKKIKSADAFTYDDLGKLIPLTERDNLKRDDMRYFSGTSGQLAPRRVSYISNDPKENPLLARMMRLSLKKAAGDLPPNQTRILKLHILSPDEIVKIISKEHPELSKSQIKQITDALIKGKRGSHISLGNSSGETTGGISIVEVDEAIKYLKSKGITNPTENDIRIIFGHELGHGVKLTDEAIAAVRGYKDPEEFYTQIGLVFDYYGITDVREAPILFDLLLDMIRGYLSDGQLDNGISDALRFLERFKGDKPMDKIKQRKLMGLIGRFGIGVLGIHTINKTLNNEKVS